MGKGPSTPSPKETAAANKETARWNTEMSFVDQYTPYGSYTYTRLPGRQIEKTRRVKNPEYRGGGGVGGYGRNENAVGDPQAPAPEVLEFMQENGFSTSGGKDSGGQPQWIEEKYYEDDPDAAPRYRLDVKLSDAEQKKLDLLNAVQIGLGELGQNQLGRVSDAMSTPVDFSKYGEISGPSYKWRRNIR